MREILQMLAKDDNSFIKISTKTKAPLKRGKMEDQKISLDQALKTDGKNEGVGVFLKDTLIRIDIDETHGLDEYIMSILPNTLTFKTRRGYHLFFTVPSQKGFKNGHYILYNQLLVEVKPPGPKQFAITPINDPNRYVLKDTEPIPLPLEWSVQKKANKLAAGIFENVLPISEGGRDEGLFKIACVLKDKFTTPDLLLKINKFAINPPLPDANVVGKWQSASEYERADDTSYQDDFVTDKGRLKINTIAKYIEKNHDIAIIMEEKVSIVCVFVDNKWEIFADMALLDIIETHIPFGLVTAAAKKQVYDLIIQSKNLRKRWKDFNHREEIIPFETKCYNMLTQKWEDHSANNLNTWVIPHDIDEHTPKIKLKSSLFYKEFLSKTSLKQDDIKMLMEWMAYCMWGYAPLKTMVFLTGPSNTGKSIVLNSIQYLVGEYNMSDVGLHELNGSNKFASAMLFNKLVNSDGDGSSKALQDVSLIKKLTGNDRIKHEDKGKPIFYFYPFAKYMFSFNRIPLQLEDKSDAFYGRLRVIELGKKLQFQDLWVRKTLIPSVVELIPYLLYKVIPQVQMTGISNSEFSRKRIKELYEASDPIMAFVNQFTEIEPGQAVHKKVLYEKYKDVCSEWEIYPEKYNQFVAELKEKGIKSKRIDRNGTKKEYFINIKMKGLYND